jgi:hypothetical protein
MHLQEEFLGEAEFIKIKAQELKGKEVSTFILINVCQYARDFCFFLSLFDYSYFSISYVFS